MTSARLADAVQTLADARCARDAGDAALFGAPSDAPPWQQPASPAEDWTERALEIVRQLAIGSPSLTVREVGPHLGATYDKRAIGAVLLAASRRGWITPGGWVDGGAERHNRPVRLWISTLYETR